MNYPMRLIVEYLVRGNLETDERLGARFRWQLTAHAAHVFEYDADHQLVWTKTYREVVTVEMTAKGDEE
jgi:hypothetical protein